jgi:hypothetical protein
MKFNERVRAQAIERVDSWIHHPALAELVSAFGEAWPVGDIGQELAGLEEISAKHWNLRDLGGGERWEAPSRELPADVALLAVDACRQLDLVDESAPSGYSYDALVVLGGGGLTPLVRTQYASELISRGVTFTRLYMLGSPRPVAEAEARLVARYAPAAKTEFDLMAAAAEQVFQLGAHADDTGALPARSDHPFAQWTVRRYDDNALPTTIIGAPSSDLQRRPNTGDTYEWMFRQGGLAAGHSLLLVTSAWFTVFQGFDAIRLLELPHVLATETVGFGMERLALPLSPTYLLQELRSGIRSAHALYAATAVES